MNLRETEASISPGYAERLAQDYDPSVVNAIAYDNWKHTDLMHQDGELLLYVRLQPERLGVEQAHDRPVLYVPGFTEGIVAKAPFAAEMASRGFDIILPGQNRKSILKDALGKKNATHSQAMNYLSVLEDEGLKDTPVDVITHSYGLPIFQTMHRLATERGWTAFDDSTLIAAAPAGSNTNEGLMRLGWRFGKHMIAENGTRKDIEDPAMLEAGAKNMLANIPRTMREVWHLAHKKVDYEELATSGLRVVVLGYAEDRLFAHAQLMTTMEDALEHGISYATPISLEEDPDEIGAIRGGRDASHNDEQFNPSRVAGAAAQILLAA